MDDFDDRRPLFITADEQVNAELLKLAAAAGTRAWCVAGPSAARRYWSTATAVVIAAEAVRDCADARLPHRDNVILLTGDQLPYDQAWPLALTMGADQVASLPAAASWLTGRLTPVRGRRARAKVVTVTGARGGVGASVLAAAVALCAAEGRRSTLLVDGDPRGGGLDLALGWENRDGLRWPELMAMPGPLDPERLGAGLPQHDGLRLLSFARDRNTVTDPQAVTAVVDCAAQAHDLIVIDAPRIGDAWLSDVVAGSDLLAVVVPGEVRAVAAARQVIAGFAGQCEKVRLVVRGPSPGRLSIADIAEAVGVPLAGELRFDPRIAGATEVGGLAGRARHGNLAAAAQAVLGGLAAAPVSATSSVSVVGT